VCVLFGAAVPDVSPEVEVLLGPVEVENVKVWVPVSVLELAVPGVELARGKTP